MKSLSIYIVCLLTLLGCRSPKGPTDVSEDSAMATAIPVNFEITSIWANPLGNNAINGLGANGTLGADTASNRINITANTNYVRKNGDSVSIYLPYYGTRTTGTTRVMNTGNTSIQFDGVPENYTAILNTAKKRSQVTFDITDDTGRHSFLIKLFKNGKVIMDVNSNHRSSIQYEGKVVSLE